MFLFALSSLSWSEPDLDIQLNGYMTAPYTLDEQGTTNDQERWFRSRIVLGESFEPLPNWRIRLAIELANGQFAGDFSTLGTRIGADAFRIRRNDRSDLIDLLPRYLSIEHRNSAWGFNVGIQSFEWGLGILSNDGLGESRFGAFQQGNTFARFGVFSVPSPSSFGFMFFGALDFVLRDDNAYVYTGDTAMQAIYGFRLVRKNIRWGVMSGTRYQMDNQDPYRPLPPSSSMVYPVDTYLEYNPTGDLWFEGELAYIRGVTDRIYSEQTRGTNSKVEYIGGVARARYSSLQLGSVAVEPLLEFGYASGDNNPTDGHARSFIFNSDYNVGLILYDELLPKLSANSIDRLSDPDLSQTPAPGLRYGIQQGGISNSIYLQLCTTLTYQDALVRLGALKAYSAVPLADAYQSGIYGGYAQAYGGGDADSSDLGTELNMRLRYRLFDALNLNVDGGYFIPGQALSVVDPLWMVMGQVQVLVGGE